MGVLTHNGEVLQSLPANASQINFDKTGTNLNSTQTENAIKEVNTKVNTNTADIAQLKSGLTNLIGDMPAKVVKESIPERGSIEIQLAANKVYQYYTWRDSEGYVYMGLIDTAYTGLITNHPIVKPQVDVISFTDGGNLALSVANSSDYAAFILLYEVSK